MFDGRIYRAALVPLLLVIVIAGFSLVSRSPSLGSTLAPDAFNGARAYAGLQSLVKRFPARRPGSSGDDDLAAYIARSLGELGSPSSASGTGGGQSNQGAVAGGFQVSTRRVRARTIEGERTLTTVIAERPGSTGESPIVILAHRDAVGRGSAAELSGTAALLELARVFSQSETRRTIVLVSTSGGSGGYGGAADFAAHWDQPLDGALVLGDLAGATARKPFVLPFSGHPSSAPEGLRRTMELAISQEAGLDPGNLGAAAEFAHFAFPLATGEEAPLNSSGVPAVLFQVSGERGPSADEPVSEARLLGFGRAALSAIYALDEGPNIPASSAPRLQVSGKLLPAWAIRLLTFALLLAPLLVSMDALARLRRRREPVLPWLGWVLTGALPFLVGAMFAFLLGVLGIVAAPSGQLSAVALPADGSAGRATLACGLVLVLALMAWPALVRRMSLPPRPSVDAAGLAITLVLLALALLVWLFNPYACLLLVAATHLWPLAVEVRRRLSVQPRAVALLAVLVGTVPLVLLLILYARELGLGPTGLAEGAVLALAGGLVGPVAALLWSAACGCLFAAILFVTAPLVSIEPDSLEWTEVLTRGPASYAGPGSLGGTESALRR
jgi:Peptidase family M28